MLQKNLCRTIPVDRLGDGFKQSGGLELEGGSVPRFDLPEGITTQMTQDRPVRQ